MKNRTKKRTANPLEGIKCACGNDAVKKQQHIPVCKRCAALGTREGKRVTVKRAKVKQTYWEKMERLWS